VNAALFSIKTQASGHKAFIAAGFESAKISKISKVPKDSSDKASKDRESRSWKEVKKGTTDHGMRIGPPKNIGQTKTFWQECQTKP